MASGPAAVGAAGATVAAGEGAATIDAASLAPLQISSRLRLLVTRPQPQADEWVAQLRALGVDALALPLLGIAGPADVAAVQAAWAQVLRPAPDQTGPGHPRPGTGDLGGDQALVMVMFVSPSAVERFFAVQPAGSAWPPGLIGAGTGPGTARALRQAGVPLEAVLTPPEAAGRFDSEALWQVLQGRCDWPGQAALIVRGEGGRDWLADTLRQQGAVVHFVEAYRRTTPVLDAAGQVLLRQAIAQPTRHCWLLSSSEAVGHLPALAPGAAWTMARAIATHARIAETARALGFGQVLQAPPSPDAVAAALQGGFNA